MKKVLITGIDSFTGIHLSKCLHNNKFDVFGTTYQTCNITNKDEITKVLKQYQPNFIIHLAGISSPAHPQLNDFYSVNTIGTINLIESIIKLKLPIKKLILASSATVYGNQNKEVLDESLKPQPASHYGASKLAMETLAKNYFNQLPIIITRPFNYTGVGQTNNFLIPKIVNTYKNNLTSIELGNLDVSREFNNVYDISKIYTQLLLCEAHSIIVNLTSQNPTKLMDIVEAMNEIAGYNIKINVNPKFVRKDEIKSLCGSSDFLKNLIDLKFEYNIHQTLKQLYTS